MCNLYSITRGQEAMRHLFRVTRDLTGNLPALPAVYPDTMAPVVRVRAMACAS
jgi:putative SOS response-associated peptidase YedK